MKSSILEWVVGIALFYVLPTLISMVFVMWHNHDNPFKKDSDSRDWIFMPCANIICAVVIVYYVIVYLVGVRAWKGICNYFKRIRIWNEDV